MLVKQLARKLRISQRRIGLAGIKDKRCLAIQYLSIQGIQPDQLQLISIPDVQIQLLGRSRIPVSPRCLRANKFRILIRDPDPDALESRIQKILAQLKELGGFPNFFGEQRFGTKRPITHLVGRALLQRDYESAVKLYLTARFPGESPSAYAAREFLEASWDLRAALKLFPRSLKYERALIQGLISNPADYGSALRNLPRRLIRLLMHGYQSYVFNLILSARIGAGLLGKVLEGDLAIFPNGKLEKVTESNLELIQQEFRAGRAIPTGLIPGRNPMLAEGIQGELELEVLEQQGMSLEGLNSWELKAGRRQLLTPFQLEYRIKQLDSGIGVECEFELPKGTYATALLREILK